MVSKHRIILYFRQKIELYNYLFWQEFGKRRDKINNNNNKYHILNNRIRKINHKNKNLSTCFKISSCVVFVASEYKSLA